MTPPRIVLDTNCVVSALLFPRGQCAWLRGAWQDQQFIPLADHECVGELLRVLAYPKFKLSADEQEDLLADYLPYVETVDISDTPEALPAVEDPDDVMFLALATRAGADALVSGDQHLLALKPTFPRPILTIAEFARWTSP